MSYDPENIFAKILEGHIPSTEIDQTETTYTFADINPQAATHALVIPKGAYTDLTDFAEKASVERLELSSSHLFYHTLPRCPLSTSFAFIYRHLP